MAQTEYKSSNSFITVEKEDLDELRTAMKRVLHAHGGDHSLTEASPGIYENLDEFFKSRFQELEVRIYIKHHNKVSECLNPDPTFLRNLCYAKVRDAKITSKQSNFDLCYFFAFGISRQEYSTRKRAKKGAVATNPASRAIISSLSHYGPELENVENYMLAKVGRMADRDIRDVRTPNIGSLSEFHSKKENATTPAVYLIGKNHFFNEDFINDFVHLSTELRNEFIANARIVFLDDVWQGDFNINNKAGVQRIKQHWHGHIEFMEKEAVKRKGKKIAEKNKVLAKKASVEMRESKTQTRMIIEQIPPLIKFLLKDVQYMPYNYFMNSVSKQEVIQWLTITL